MISDMNLRKYKNLLYMPFPENHPIDQDKINQWVNSQCNDEAKMLANLFKKYTMYISWKQFYETCIIVFEKLYMKVENLSYCFFTKESLSNVSYDQKSNYWILLLLIDYYIDSKKEIY